jgi:hypothetical protein
VDLGHRFPAPLEDDGFATLLDVAVGSVALSVHPQPRGEVFHRLDSAAFM